MLHLRTTYLARIGSRGLRLASVGSPLTLLFACTVGPNYVKPTTEVPAAYKEMDGWKVAQPRDEIIRGAWWEIFNDPELNRLEEQVNISNQNVAAAEAQFRQARAQVQAARSAYFPTATVGTSFTRSLSRPAWREEQALPDGTTSNPPTSRQRSTTPSPTSDFRLPMGASWEIRSLGPGSPHGGGQQGERPGERGRP